VIGTNGAGKTTLLKSLIGELPLLAGERHASAGCRIGYYDQQQRETLDLGASPAEHLQALAPDAREQSILDFLGGFDFRGSRAEQAIAPFSGGEKARLALAMVVWQRPNLLILDEPTNHLDLDMRQALTLALQDFSGALLLVTHDRHLLRHTVDTLWLVAGGRVSEYEGDLTSYERSVLTAPDTATAPPPASAGADDAGNSARNRRQEAAALRAQQKPLRDELKRLESAMTRTEADMEALQSQLSDPELYDKARGSELSDLLRREGQLRQLATEQEDRWLTLQEALESLAPEPG
jgi:ATP-binding cassette subfamily F protein 3